MVGIISEAEQGNYQPLHRCDVRCVGCLWQQSSCSLLAAELETVWGGAAQHAAHPWCSRLAAHHPGNPSRLLSFCTARPPPCCRYMAALLQPYSSSGLDPAWLEPAPKRCRMGVELLSCSS